MDAWGRTCERGAFPRRKSGTLLCLQVSGGTGQLVVMNWFIHTVTTNILRWSFCTCAECAQSLLAPGPICPEPLCLCWGSIQHGDCLCIFRPSALVLLAVCCASPWQCKLSERDCSLPHGDAHRSECLQPLLGPWVLLAAPTAPPSPSPSG